MIEKEKVREGGNLPEKTKTKQPINNLTLHTTKVNDKKQKQERVKEYIQEGIKNGYNIILIHIENGELTKKPNWLGMNTSNYQAKIDDLLVALSKKAYGYGVLVGKQLGDFYLICIDIDIDSGDCKDRISKDFEGLLSKNGIKYYKEITKSNRIHYYIALDKITDKMELNSKLPYDGTCIKYKDGKEITGEIELFIKNKSVVVYDGFINDNKPFFIGKTIINDYRNFEKFLDEYISKFIITVEKKRQKNL